MSKRFIAVVLSVSVLLGPAGLGTGKAKAQTVVSEATTTDQQAMDKLLAPIALYPDALLAQVLACASSPQQLTEVNTWLAQNSQLQGSELQEAAETAGFDASFIAMVLFPDVLPFMGQNLEWTTEVGNAFSSDQESVLDSVQRLRAQAQAAGNLKTTPQQEVTTDTQNGQSVIVVQPANPQVVYVPQYNPQTVYTTPPPAPAEDNSGDVVAAAVIGFALGVALGNAMDDDYGYYGWNSWGMHWHSNVVVVHGGHWHVPPHGRYPYARPLPAYRPPAHIHAPRYNNINVNINNNRNVNTRVRTPRPTTVASRSNRAASTTRSTRTARSQPVNNVSRGRTQTASARKASPATQMQRGSRTSAFSGYQKGNRTRAASTRGRSSARSQTTRGRRR